MAKPLDRSDIPDCASCPYAQHGPWHVCVACAAETLQSIQSPCHNGPAGGDQATAPLSRLWHRDQ